jgi:hypothetical protein
LDMTALAKFASAAYFYGVQPVLRWRRAEPTSKRKVTNV